MEKNMKYAIYGAGSLGIVLSAYLKNAGEQFDVIDRNPKSVDALNSVGAKVVGKVNMLEKVNAILESEVKDKYDIILLLTKQVGNDEIIKKASSFLADGGVICTFQNGLPEKQVAKIIGADRTYGCAVGWGATRLEPGVSELTSENTRETLTFSFGSLDGHKDDKFDEIVRILSKMGNVEIEENFIGARWAKLLINSAFSGMSTVIGGTFGEAAKNKKSRKILQNIIKECIDVANACNIKIEKIQGKDIVKLLDYKSGFKKWLSFQIIPLAIKKHRLLKASMLQDIEKGRLTEVDAINGVVSEYARECGSQFPNEIVQTPYNDKVIKIIHAMERGEMKPSLDNLKYFELDELVEKYSK